LLAAVRAVFTRYPDGALDPAGERWVRVVERELLAGLPLEADGRVMARGRLAEVLGWYPPAALAAGPAALLDSLQRQLLSALDRYDMVATGSATSRVEVPGEAGEESEPASSVQLAVGTADNGSGHPAQHVVSLSATRAHDHAPHARAVRPSVVADVVALVASLPDSGSSDTSTLSQAGIVPPAPSATPESGATEEGGEASQTEPTTVVPSPLLCALPSPAPEAEVSESISRVADQPTPVQARVAPAPPTAVPPAAVGEPRTAVDAQIDRDFVALVLARRPAPAISPAAAPPRPDESAPCPAAPAASSSTASRLTADGMSSKK
jgi:hypothetical protein